MKLKYPIPVNETERVWELSEFDIDYTEVAYLFKDITKLAAKIAGTEISLINLIDTYTQWTIANYGMPLEQMEREESVCQYTIATPEQFEVKRLSADERFSSKFYVSGEPKLDYYFGIPLVTSNGYSLGALCVLDKKQKDISPEKVELLKIVAKEIVNRLISLKTIQELKSKVSTASDVQKKIAHDIRGPLGGIISLTEIIKERGDNNKLEQVLDFISMINKAGHSLLELATEILTTEDKISAETNQTKDNQLNLVQFKEKLERLYIPQATNKNIHFRVVIQTDNIGTLFPKNRLLQIAGNLITNAIKFTPEQGNVTVALSLSNTDVINKLQIVVSDTGIGLSEQDKNVILQGRKSSTEGTDGETGYGFGLNLVKHLVDKLNGEMKIESTQNSGTSFIIDLPMVTS
ncbi:MAG: GAF domain-containing sensor histidine kinase [Sphingobacteriia bacterium]|nr:GAF domain-containing sensor histidine kinase [Sphingobacteriia bacterium]